MKIYFAGDLSGEKGDVLSNRERGEECISLAYKILGEEYNRLNSFFFKKLISDTFEIMGGEEKKTKKNKAVGLRRKNNG